MVLYLKGNGGLETFEISPSESLDSAELDAWLDVLQDPTTGIPGKVTVVIDADHSGSFVAALTPPTDRDRIVIASARSSQSASFLSGGDISFSAYFLNRVLNGSTVRNAFKHAPVAMRFEGRGQRATWDDNGNGIADEKTDGQIALLHRIGMGVQLAGVDPIIGSIIAPDSITSTSSWIISVDDVTTTGSIPSDGVVATILAPSGRAPVQVTLTETPASSGDYEVVYNSFSEKGIYVIAVTATDSDGNTSLPAEPSVERTDGSVASPDAYEVDDVYTSGQEYDVDLGGTQSHNFHDFGDEDWYELTVGTTDIVTIETFNLGTNADTSLAIYREAGGLTLIDSDDDSSPDDFDVLGEQFLFSPDAYGLTAGTFYLRVMSSSGTTLAPDYEVNGTYDIRIIREIGGCEIPGQLKIKLQYSGTDALLSGATVTISKSGSTLSPATATGGIYIFDAVVNSQYTVSITPPSGYSAIANQLVTPVCGALTSVTYTLTPSSAPTSPAIALTPSSWHFGSVTPSDYSDQVFTVENVGGGLLSGTATSVTSPFQIISSASYSLDANATDTVTIHFTPTTTSDIVNNESAVFSSGGSYALALSGNLTTPTTSRTARLICATFSSQRMRTIMDASQKLKRRTRDSRRFSSTRSTPSASNAGASTSCLSSSSATSARSPPSTSTSSTTHRSVARNRRRRVRTVQHLARRIRICETRRQRSCANRCWYLRRTFHRIQHTQSRRKSHAQRHRRHRSHRRNRRATTRENDQVRRIER